MMAAPTAMVCLVAVPLVGAAVAFVLRRRAVVAIAPTLVLQILATVALVQGVQRSGGVWMAIGGWSPPLGIPLQADGASAALVATATVVMTAICGYATAHLPRVRAHSDLDTGAFWPLLLLLWSGLDALLLSGDFFNLYVGLEVMGLSAVALVALSGAEARQAGTRYLLVTLIGSMLYLFGVGLVYAQYGRVDLEAWSLATRASPSTVIAFVLMLGGLALKTAFFPVHFWLPPAHGGALAPISAILSGLVVKASFYLLARIWICFPDPSQLDVVAETLGAMGVAAIAWGSLQAMRQRQLKLLIAYSTVAQLGYLLLAFPLAQATDTSMAWKGAFLFVAAHACAKAALFLTAGTFKLALQDEDLDALRGAGTLRPLTAFSHAAAGTALVGLPPTGGFAAKWLLLLAAAQSGRWLLAAVIVVGSLLSAAYVFPVLARFMAEPRHDASRVTVPVAMDAAAFVLAVIAVGLGVTAAAPADFIELRSPTSIREAVGP